MDKSIEITLIIIGGTVLLMLMVYFIQSVIFAYQKKYYQHLQEIDSMKENYAQELLKTRLEIKENTLRTISHEIHDNIGQVLSLANMQLTAIELPDNAYATNKIEKAMELVSRAIHDLRDLSKTMNADNIVRVGLIKSVEADLELIQKSGKLNTAMQISGQGRRIDPSKEIIVYRITQEAINNIIKHAEASTISINFHYSPTSLAVSILDDGKGIRSSGLDSTTGVGMQNMTTRANLIHAKLNVESEPAKGTTLTLTLPI